VWAIANTKAHLRVLWGAADRGIAGPPPGVDFPIPPTVVDRFGLVIAVSGTRVDIPPGAWPSLAGRFVCPGPDAVYITDQLAAP
jgi:hypothetical protein